MELSQFISPSGPWHQVWLAAHWDKKLKKQDYDDMDVRALLAAFLEHRQNISLRAIGHLLCGATKIFSKKCSYFDDDAIELRTRLMMVFSTLKDNGGKKEDAAAAGALTLQGLGTAAALREVDLVAAAAQGQAALAQGRRHVARLEDITLRDHTPLSARGAATDEAFGAMDGDLREAMSRLREMALPPMILGAAPGGPGDDAPLETQPLINLDPEPEEETALDIVGHDLVVADVDAGTPMPIDMDIVLPPPDDDVAPLVEFSPPRHYHEANPIDALFDDPADELLPEPADPASAAGGVVAADEGQLVDVQAKKRRKAHFIFDDATEISKEVYNSYVNDRTSITRKSLVDYSVFLPHYSAAMPHFTTTFTDLCPSLVESLSWGAGVAEKRRRLMQREEGEGMPRQGDDGEPEFHRPFEGVEDAGGGPGFLSPFGGSMPQAPAGLVSAAAASQPSPLFDQPRDEEFLLAGAPATMGAVVTAGMDEEDQSQNAAARVGYSGRTEKMHRFLAREFRSTETPSLSYESLCRMQSAGRRELIAGCFFELLVLRTNGVIGLQQENPMSDIRISKANSWAKK